MNALQNVIDFLQQTRLQYFATVGLDGKPKVRPFQMMFAEDGKLYYCTGTKKAVYQELEKSPYFEICVSTHEKWLRVEGRAQFVSDYKVKEKIIKTSPLVKSIYGTAENPDLAAFYIAEGKAVWMDFSGKPPEIILF